MWFDFFKPSGISVLAPTDGVLKEITEVEDEAFSSKSMGDGFAVTPSAGEVVAPIGGTVIMVFPTGHAIGIRSDDGIEILVHIGVDSVNLKGEGFILAVQKDQRVEAGQLILRYDLPLLQEKLTSTDVIIVVTSGQKCEIKGVGRRIAVGTDAVACIRRR